MELTDKAERLVAKTIVLLQMKYNLKDEDIQMLDSIHETIYLEGFNKGLSYFDKNEEE